MVIDYFNGCVRARSLGTAAQIKSMGEPSLVFTYRSMVWFSSAAFRNIKDCVMEEERI
jgi:hypothetical protein